MSVATSIRPDPRSSGTPNEGCRARSRPSRPRRATPARPSAPIAAAARARSGRRAGHAGSSSPAAANRSSANCRMVSNMLYRVRAASGRRPRATCAPTSRGAPGRRPRRRPSTTAQMPARSNPPENTDDVAQQLALVIGQQVVGPAHRVAQRLLALGSARDPCNSRKRSPSRSRTSTALIAAIRAAASSMPSGSPSRVSQISITAVASAGRATRSRAGRPRPARRTT